MARPSIYRNQHSFAKLPKLNITRTVMDRSSSYLTTFDEDYLIPFFVDEVIPGDTLKLRNNSFIRTSPLVSPIMDNLYFDTFYFFVPLRLLWEHLEQFFGFRKNPNDSIDYLIPTVNIKASVSSLADYMGIPVNTPNNLEVNALIFRAYYLIYNEWFRDENLINSVDISMGDSGVYNGSYYDVVFSGNSKPLKRGKRFDYFTSSLVSAQQGQPIDIGLIQGLAPVVIGSNFQGTPIQGLEGSRLLIDNRVTGTGSDSLTYAYINDSNSSVNWTPTSSSVTNKPLYYLNADLGSSGNTVTINEFRMAMQMQAYLERENRSGNRYTEYLQYAYGVDVPDYRLQRPEYLGGSTTRFHINPVQQTSSTDNVSPQGNLTANGTLISSEHGFTKSFYEHGYVIGLCNVRSDLRYQQGLNKIWSRRTRYDFYDPIFANLGEQAVLSKEIFADGSSDDELVFGYQERWAEYRFKPSLITGKMRSGVDGSLDVWHLAQYFNERPQLTKDFIEEQVDMERVVAVPTEPHFIMDTWFDYTCIRPMPLYSIPADLGRF